VAYLSIDELRGQLGGGNSPTVGFTPEYVEKMLHEIPEVRVVDRAAFILERTAGKRVLEFGASGLLHDKIIGNAAFYRGIDREPAPHVIPFDLDDVSHPWFPIAAYHDGSPWDIIIAGEVLEHLSNPGYFLTRLHQQYANVPLILTVPNAFSKVASQWLGKGIENVNRDHVSWYSPKTLSTLLSRVGYREGDLFWYGGTDARAEGLIVVTE
jgi:Methyltransferase domain